MYYVCLYTVTASKSCTNIPFSFLLHLISISSLMNAKRNLKFKREVKSNGNTLLHAGLFFSLVFLMNRMNSERFSPSFWYAPFLFVDQWMQKQISKLEGSAQSHEELETTKSCVCTDTPLWQALPMIQTCPCNAEAYCSFEKKKITLPFTATAEVRSTL